MTPTARSPAMAAAPLFAGAGLADGSCPPGAPRSAAPAGMAAPLPLPGERDFSPGDRGFIALCQAYRASGGIARGDDLAHWLVGRGLGGSRQLAALLVAGDVFSFDWRGAFWVPMFQFQPPALGPGSSAAEWPLACRQVLAELRPVLDGWQLAAWFVRANTWLRGERPLDLLQPRPERVLAAARADRYVNT